MSGFVLLAHVYISSNAFYALKKSGTEIKSKLMAVLGTQRLYEHPTRYFVRAGNLAVHINLVLSGGIFKKRT